MGLNNHKIGYSPRNGGDFSIIYNLYQRLLREPAISKDACL